MLYVEKKMNLFKCDGKYYLAHCISSDYSLGRGIAIEFRDRFNMGVKLNKYGQKGIWPNCILIEMCFNLITKEFYDDKPSYSSLRSSLEKMRDIIKEKDIKYLAMPRIGSKLDRLNWELVSLMIRETFKDMDLEILICIKDVRC